MATVKNPHYTLAPAGLHFGRSKDLVPLNNTLHLQRGSMTLKK